MYLFFNVGIWNMSKHFGLLCQIFLDTDMLTSLSKTFHNQIETAWIRFMWRNA